jgi:hypothetical protein
MSIDFNKSYKKFIALIIFLFIVILIIKQVYYNQKTESFKASKPTYYENCINYLNNIENDINNKIYSEEDNIFCKCAIEKCNKPKNSYYKFMNNAKCLNECKSKHKYLK